MSFLLFPQTYQKCESFEDIVIFHYNRYPQMKAEDLYKLAHQAAMGNEHLKSDSLRFLKYLEEEIKTLTPSSDDLLIERLSPDNDIVRVNLKVYLFYEKDISKLLNAMILTSEKFPRSKNLLIKYLDVIYRLIQEGKIQISENEFKDLIDEMAKKDYPAIHHTKTYKEIYKPAYRVISLKYLEGL